MISMDDLLTYGERIGRAHNEKPCLVSSRAPGRSDGSAIISRSHPISRILIAALGVVWSNHNRTALSADHLQKKKKKNYWVILANILRLNWWFWTLRSNLELPSSTSITGHWMPRRGTRGKYIRDSWVSRRPVTRTSASAHLGDHEYLSVSVRAHWPPFRAQFGYLVTKF